jgi:hypothetical protein
MRRLLAAGAIAVVALASTPIAGAQEGYAGGWTDPAPSATRDDKPLGYLDGVRPLSGQVSHPNGISSVTVVLVVDPENPPSDGCVGQVDTQAALEPSGAFTVHGSFPCNLVYELRATAQANPGTGLGSSTPGPYAMPLLLAVAVPPAPVSRVDADLDVDGDDKQVTLVWPGGSEPDLLGYVVSRTTDGTTEELGQVDADEFTSFVDDDPPPGVTSTYSVTAVRNGPDGEIEQVPAEPTSVDVDVPGTRASDAGGDGTGGSAAGSGDGSVDPELAGSQSQVGESGRPDAGSLSSVRRRASAGARPTPPTTADTGFSETIDYGELGGPDDQAAVLPTGDPSVVAVYDETITGSPWSNKETMSFVAGGLAVLMAAATVLTVTRRAARAAY